jgi:hypothetical protein
MTGGKKSRLYKLIDASLFLSFGPFGIAPIAAAGRDELKLVARPACRLSKRTALAASRALKRRRRRRR